MDNGSIFNVSWEVTARRNDPYVRNRVTRPKVLSLSMNGELISILKDMEKGKSCKGITSAFSKPGDQLRLQLKNSHF
jgi:hypothetical protein